MGNRGNGTAWGGHLTCNEEIQIGSNPIFSTKFCPGDGIGIRVTLRT